MFIFGSPPLKLEARITIEQRTKSSENGLPPTPKIGPSRKSVKNLHEKPVEKWTKMLSFSSHFFHGIPPAWKPWQLGFRWEASCWSPPKCGSPSELGTSNYRKSWENHGSTMGCHSKLWWYISATSCGLLDSILVAPFGMDGCGPVNGAIPKSHATGCRCDALDCSQDINCRYQKWWNVATGFSFRFLSQICFGSAARAELYQLCVCASVFYAPNAEIYI